MKRFFEKQLTKSDCDYTMMIEKGKTSNGFLACFFLICGFIRLFTTLAGPVQLRLYPLLRNESHSIIISFRYPGYCLSIISFSMGYVHLDDVV